MKRHDVDWDAVIRDHRTCKFTDPELAAKYKIHKTTLMRRRKSDQAKNPNAWPRDLRDSIRATTAVLLTNVQGTADEGVKDVVLVAAEINRQVIMGHRSELREAREIAVAMLLELKTAAAIYRDADAMAMVLAGEQATPDQIKSAGNEIRKALNLGNRVQIVKALAETLTKLHTGERTAYDLNDQPPGSDEFEEVMRKLADQAVLP